MGWRFINLWIRYDRIKNVLYRVYHDEFEPDFIRLEKIAVLIGTNNIEIKNQTEIVEGVKLLIKQIHARQPDADLFVLGIFPRDGFEKNSEKNQ